MSLWSVMSYSTNQTHTHTQAGLCVFELTWILRLKADVTKTQYKTEIIHLTQPEAQESQCDIQPITALLAHANQNQDHIRLNCEL